MNEKIVIIHPYPGIDGITTAIVVFIFACLAWPHLIKNRSQYYAAFVCACGIILLHTLSWMIQSIGFNVIAGFCIGVLQLASVIMLMMCAGGLTLRNLGDEIAGAYEVIRRGESEKTVIVPLRGEQPKKKDQAMNERPPVVNIDDDIPPPPPPPAQRGDDAGIPLE